MRTIEKQPTQISDPCCNSPFECIYLKPDHLTCIEILDCTCHFFLCSACVYCAVAVWWGAAESGEHLHGRAEPVWGTVAVHSEPWHGDQELIAGRHVRSHDLVIITVGEGLKKRLSKNSVVALLCMVAGPCLRHPAYPTPSSPKGKRWYLTPVRVILGTPCILCTTRPMSLLIYELMLPFWLTRTSVHILHVTKYHLAPSLGDLEHWLPFLSNP